MMLQRLGIQCMQYGLLHAKAAIHIMLLLENVNMMQHQINGVVAEQDQLSNYIHINHIVVGKIKMEPLDQEEVLL